MTSKKHGLSIGIERHDRDIFLSIKAVGTLTHEDYELITPMVDAALAEVKEPRVKALIDATELEGWEIRAAWDDFKLGLKHGSEFEKVAIYGNHPWQKVFAKLASWFTSGEVKSFDEMEDAVSWLLTG